MEQMVTVRAREVGLFSYWPFFLQPIIDNVEPGNVYVFADQTFSNVSSNDFPSEYIYYRKALHPKKWQLVRKVLCAQFFVLNMMRNGMSAQVFVLIIVVGVQATRSGGQSSSACSPYGHF